LNNIYFILSQTRGLHHKHNWMIQENKNG